MELRLLRVWKFPGLDDVPAISLESTMDVGDCQNYGPFLGPYYNTGPNTGPNLGNPKRDHNFDNPPFVFRMRKQILGR